MVFIRKNRNFTSKTRFSIAKTLEMPFYSGKYGFYHEKHKFNLKNERLYRKKILKMKFYHGDL